MEHLEQQGKKMLKFLQKIENKNDKKVYKNLFVKKDNKKKEVKK